MNLILTNDIFFSCIASWRNQQVYKRHESTKSSSWPVTGRRREDWTLENRLHCLSTADNWSHQDIDSWAGKRDRWVATNLPLQSKSGCDHYIYGVQGLSVADFITDLGCVRLLICADFYISLVRKNHHAPSWWGKPETMKPRASTTSGGGWFRNPCAETRVLSRSIHIQGAHKLSANSEIVKWSSKRATAVFAVSKPHENMFHFSKQHESMVIWVICESVSQLFALVYAGFAHRFLDVLFMLLEHLLHASFSCDHWTWVLVPFAPALVSLVTQKCA